MRDTRAKPATARPLPKPREAGRIRAPRPWARACADAGSARIRQGRAVRLAALPGAVQGAVIMNYRHAYHAGNHADVFKHLVLARIFALLGRKDTPYAYLDSHSGVGLYDLQGDEASRTGSGSRASPACGSAKAARATGRLPGRDPSPESGRLPALLPGLAGTGTAPDPRPGPRAAQRTASRGRPPAQGQHGWRTAGRRAPGRRLAAAAGVPAGAGKARGAADRSPFRAGRRIAALCRCARRGDRADAPDGGGDLVSDQGRAPAQAFLPGPGT